MSLDLSKNEWVVGLHSTIHLAQYANEFAAHVERLQSFSRPLTHGEAIALETAEAITDPAKSADLIRALVERAGLRVIGFRETSSFPFASVETRALADGVSCCGSVEIGIAIEIMHVPIATRQWATMLRLRDVPETIARLLALASGAGATAVLAALRGDG